MVARFRHVQSAPRAALARGAAQRDRRHRRAGPPPADGAWRHHRSADFGQADPGGRLGVPPGARGRHDAAAGGAPSRHPAARHRREHLARHHLDLHLRAGAVLGACGSVAGRIRDAGFGAVSFRLHRSLCRAFQRAGGGRSGGQVERRSRAGVRHLQPHAMVDRARSRRRAENHRAAAVHRARRSSRRIAGVRGVARRRQRHGDRSRDVERAGVGVERGGRARAVAAGRNRRGARYRVRRRGVAGLGRGRRKPRKDQIGADRGRRVGALAGPRRQPRNALYGDPKRGGRNKPSRHFRS